MNGQTFTASDGKEWTLDEWHPLPFLLPYSPGSLNKFAGVPTTSAGPRLVRKFSDGSERWWSPFTTTKERFDEMANPATHWMVKTWTDYVI